MGTLKHKSLINEIPSFPAVVSKPNSKFIMSMILKNSKNLGPVSFKWDTRDSFFGENI